MVPKITRVEALPGLKIKARFEGGGVRLYSLLPLQKSLPIFKDLSEVPGLFERVQVDQSGYAVIWNDEIDLASEEIWFNGLSPVYGPK